MWVNYRLVCNEFRICDYLCVELEVAVHKQCLTLGSSLLFCGWPWQSFYPRSKSIINFRYKTVYEIVKDLLKDNFLPPVWIIKKKIKIPQWVISLFPSHLFAISLKFILLPPYAWEYASALQFSLCPLKCISLNKTNSLRTDFFLI